MLMGGQSWVSRLERCAWAEAMARQDYFVGLVLPGPRHVIWSLAGWQQDGGRRHGDVPRAFTGVPTGPPPSCIHTQPVSLCQVSCFFWIHVPGTRTTTVHTDRGFVWRLSLTPMPISFYTHYTTLPGLHEA